MLWVSFAWTTPALLAGAKTCTRRDWTTSHALQFRTGMIVGALDRNLRRGGSKIGLIRMSTDAYREDISAMPDSDYEAEGFAWLHAHPDQISQAAHQQFGDFSRSEFELWRQSRQSPWVVRFEWLGKAKEDGP